MKNKLPLDLLIQRFLEILCKISPTYWILDLTMNLLKKFNSFNLVSCVGSIESITNMVTCNYDILPNIITLQISKILLWLSTFPIINTKINNGTNNTRIFILNFDSFNHKFTTESIS